MKRSEASEQQEVTCDHGLSHPSAVWDLARGMLLRSSLLLVCSGTPAHGTVHDQDGSLDYFSMVILNLVTLTLRISHSPGVV